MFRKRIMMTLDAIETILVSCRRIGNGRNIYDVMDALEDEVKELDEELVKFNHRKRPGADGILGESVDVLLCAVDMMYMENNDITAEEIMAKIVEKLAKWERVHG
jgi:hypothetical protein